MPRLIALDMGSHAVKVTTFRVGSRGQVDLDKRFHRAVPQDGTSPTLEHRLAALDALVDDHPEVKPSGSDVVVLAWPSSEAAFHRVAMPFADRAQIERTLPFAIENEVPFELDEMVLSWRVAEQMGQSQVLAVLSKRDRVAEWLNALAERGLDPAAVHVDADLFGPWGAQLPLPVVTDDGTPPRSALVAVIDVGHVHTSVSIVRNGTVVYVRSVNVGGWSFTRAIQDALGCSWAEAEALKHGQQHADLPPDEEVTDPGVRRHSGYSALPAEARQAVDGAVGLLLAEVRSALIKAEDTLEGEVVEVRVCGGSARIDELWDYLAADLGVPVGRATDPRGEPSPGAFAVTQALAVASVASGSGPADLRVGALAYRGRTDVLRAALGYGVVFAGFFTAALVVMFAVQYQSLRTEQSETEEAVRQIVTRAFPEVPPGSLQTMSAAVAVMREFTQDAVQRAEVLGAGSTGIPPTVDTLYHVTKAFPEHPTVTVELSDLTITPQSISFNAETDTYAAAAMVEESLKKDPRFANASKGQDQKLANQRIRFPVTIPLGDAAAEGDGAGEGE